MFINRFGGNRSPFRTKGLAPPDTGRAAQTVLSRQLSSSCRRENQCLEQVKANDQSARGEKVQHLEPQSDTSLKWHSRFQELFVVVDEGFFETVL